jgi:nucleotide-binding universal stress UspA family protein
VTSEPLHVLVPVDGSELSNRALDWAIALARRTGATLSICSVFDPMSACVVTAAGAPYDPGPLLATLLYDAHRFCHDGVERARAAGVAATRSVREGTPSRSIGDVARELGADIVVLGTHARRGLALGILGSVTEAIVRSSDAAVVALRAESTISQHGPVVAAIDDSDASVVAATFAVRLASALGVAIHLVHVSDSAATRTASMATMAAVSDVAGVASSVELRAGPVVDTLIAFAMECGASLLATGTHGRGSVSRLFLGSVADGLLRASPIPVLTRRSLAAHAAVTIG